MNVLDLFSGIGGFSLGLERAGFTTVAFCEIEPFCRDVLRKHWPHVPIYGDIRALDAHELRHDGIEPDVICGGFPCQDISRAGSGLGLAGERSGLWSEYRRLICELRPRYVIVENVAALLDDGMGVVLRHLAEDGYDAEWQVLSACAVGAPHVRQRVFIVAYPNGQHGRTGIWYSDARSDGALQTQHCLEGARAISRARLEDPSALYRGAHELTDGMDRNRAIGNSIYPVIPEIIGRAILKVAQ